MSAHPRLYVDTPSLQTNQSIDLPAKQQHYLHKVLRLRDKDTLIVFNNKDGAWHAHITWDNHTKPMRLVCIKQTSIMLYPPDLWVLFSPVRRERTHFIIEKATEMGARRLCPIHTRYTRPVRKHTDKWKAHAIAAATQCGNTFVPEIAAVQTLAACTQNWPKGRSLWFCDETLQGKPNNIGDNTQAMGIKSALLIGPEGGFTADERALLNALPFAQAIALGPRILRAETAVVAAMTWWHMSFGGWI